MENTKKQQKYVSMQEMIIFLMGTFFLTMMQGMQGNYRQAYLVNVLQIDSDSVGFINSFCTIASFAINFFLMMIIDRAPKDGKNKFKPIVATWAIPTGILAVLLFWTPSFIPKIKPKPDYPLKTLYPRAFQTGLNRLIYYDFTTVE